MHRFSIVIPTYNSVHTLIPLLQSFAGQVADDVKIIVVDDASTDDTESQVKAFNADYLRQTRRQGPAAARNRGALLADCEWLIFTDADTCFEPDTMLQINTVISECDGDAFVGTYAGYPANEGFMPRYKALWELVTINEVLMSKGGRYILLNTWAPRPGLVKKKVFDALGGFDESFGGADLEDMEFGYRLFAEGHKIFFAPAVKIKHHYPATLWKELRPFARRCRLWMGLKKPKGFDSAGEGTPGQALMHICGFGSFMLGIIGIIWLPMLLPALVLLVCYFWGNRRFFFRACGEEGCTFAVRAFCVCFLHTIVMGFSAGIGLVQGIGARK
jgi:GT2 family glycosyltransferase